MYFVSDDGGIFNAFSMSDFDKNGRYIQNPNYKLEDFDIIARFRDFESAFQYAEEMNEKAAYNEL